MSNFVVLGTDTDAGKTTFSLLWMTAFSESYAYWKPFETGDSDSETVRRICPSALVVSLGIPDRTRYIRYFTKYSRLSTDFLVSVITKA